MGSSNHSQQPARYACDLTTDRLSVFFFLPFQDNGSRHDNDIILSGVDDDHTPRDRRSTGFRSTAQNPTVHAKPFRRVSGDKILQRPTAITLWTAA